MNSITSTPPKSLANIAIHLVFCEEKGNSQSIPFTKLEGCRLLRFRDTQLRIRSVRSYPPYGVAPPYVTSAIASITVLETQASTKSNRHGTNILVVKGSAHARLKEIRAKAMVILALANLDVGRLRKISN